MKKKLRGRVIPSMVGRENSVKIAKNNGPAMGQETDRIDNIGGKRGADMAALLEQIAAGLSITDACTVVGIARATYYGWLNTVPQLSEQVDKARVEAKRRMVGIVLAAAEKDARWAAWFLERRYPAEYGRAPLQTIVGAKAEQSEPDFDLSQVSNEQLVEILNPDEWERRRKELVEAEVAPIRQRYADLAGVPVTALQ